MDPAASELSFELATVEQSGTCVRTICAWCQLQVHHFSRHDLQERYNTLADAIAAHPDNASEKNTMMRTLNALLGLCLTEVDGAELREHPIMARSVVDGVPPPPPAVAPPATAAVVPAAAAAAASTGPAEEGMGSGAGRRRGTSKTLKQQCDWVAKIKDEDWAEWIKDHPLGEPEPGQHYRCQVYVKPEGWVTMPEEASREFAAIALREERRGRQWITDNLGHRKQFHVWWTGGFEGVQQNLVTNQFRPIRLVPWEVVPPPTAAAAAAAPEPPRDRWQHWGGGRGWEDRENAWGDDQTWRREGVWALPEEDHW